VSRPTLEARAAALRAERVPFVLARVVRAERPTSAKPGDQAIVFGDGTIEGFVGGTCAESTVRAQGLALLDSGEPLLLRITPEPEPEQDGMLTVHNPCLSGGTLEIFLEPEMPAPLLLVHGSTPIAEALAGLAEHLGFSVASAGADDAADVVSGAAAVVVASHGRDEEPALTAALAAGVAYVGLVASRKRGEAIVASLDVDEEQRARVRTPCGLDIGARTPAEVALSILAEIVAERRRASGREVADETPAATTGTPAAAGTATDPVCGMSVATVDASLHLDHDGARFWFCGSGCLRAFAADPTGYLEA
jgi:xanthine dehydrogenase accessory factor